MFCDGRRRGLVLIGLIAAACGGRREPPARKVAIIPFENLSGEPKLDWMGRGFAELLRSALAGSAASEAIVAGSLRQAPATGAARVVEGYYQLAGGRLRAHVVVEDAATNRAAKTISASDSPERLLPLSALIAKSLDPQARPPGTSSEPAARAWIEALEASDAKAATAAYERATAADPGFGAPWVAWMQWLIAHGQLARAGEVAAAGLAKGPRQDVERAQLRLMAAMLGNDRAARRKALAELARATPADPDVLRRLAEASLVSREYADAAAAYRAALERSPDDPALLNEMGYALAYGGDLAGAVKALDRCRELRPQDANPLDSLGDVHFYSGAFREAEKFYLGAYEKQRTFLAGGDLYKAAWARLMAGDLKGADEFFARFVQARQEAKDGLISYRQAQWEFVTGRRKQAFERAEQLAAKVPGPVSSLAASQLAIWNLELGDAASARSWAMRARAPVALTGTARFLVLPPAPPAEWAARAAKMFPPAVRGMGDYAVICALLLSGQYREAEPRLQQLRRQSAPSSPEMADVLLAWSLVEIGRVDDARPLLGPNPIPEALQERPFLSLAFPRLLHLRGVAAEKAGRKDEARRNYELFQRLSGK